MKIRTTSALQKYLESEKLSPESFARKCLISNMTIRRYLARPEDSPLPMKYWAAFDQATLSSPSENHPSEAWFAEAMEQDFSGLADSLEESGQGEHDLNQMGEDISAKKENPNVGKKLKEAASVLFNAIKNNQLPNRDRFLAIGALIYFLNPVDLIPDAMPGVGFLDDYAVLSMVVARLAMQIKLPDSSEETALKKV